MSAADDEVDGPPPRHIGDRAGERAGQQDADDDTAGDGADDGTALVLAGDGRGERHEHLGDDREHTDHDHAGEEHDRRRRRADDDQRDGRQHELRDDQPPAVEHIAERYQQHEADAVADLRHGHDDADGRLADAEAGGDRVEDRMCVIDVRDRQPARDREQATNGRGSARDVTRPGDPDADASGVATTGAGASAVTAPGAGTSGPGW